MVELTATPAGQPGYSFPGLGSGWSPNGQTGSTNSVTYSYSAGAATPGTLPVTYDTGSGQSGPTNFVVSDQSPGEFATGTPLSLSAWSTTPSWMFVFGPMWNGEPSSARTSG